jgi:hypothetical protein
MKTLHESSKNMRKTIGLGLLGLLLSVVPTGQVCALTVNLTYEGTSVTGTLNTSTPGVLTINEIWGPNVKLDTYNFSYSGVGGSTYSYNEPALFSTSATPNAFVITYTGLTSSGNITILQNVTNHTGYTWSDYHKSFYYKKNNQWVAFPNLADKSMSGSMGQFAWDGFTAHWIAQDTDEYIYDGDTGYFSITGAASKLFALNGANGAIKMVVTPTITIIPEPGSMAMIGVGLAGLVGLRKMNRSAKSA